MSIVVTPIKFHPVSETHGYAVEKQGERYVVSYVQNVSKDNKPVLLREAFSRSQGKLLAYDSPFVADHVIRKEILPLYTEVKK